MRFGSKLSASAGRQGAAALCLIFCRAMRKMLRHGGDSHAAPGRGHVRWLVVVLFAFLLAACMTYTGVRRATADRGLRFSHPQHVEEGLGCTDCHEGEGDEPVLPDHDLCGTCHDIDVDNIDAEACGVCHTHPEQAVRPRTKILDAERKFAHAPHTAKDIACETCHPDPDAATLPKGAVKPFCLTCHGDTDPALTTCDVCHSEIRRDVRPTYRGATRIPHDTPQIWERRHGQEWKLAPDYCALCHDEEASCEACHRTQPPRSHTVTWRRQRHGLRATWDRAKCSVCHEEDSCQKCHRNTTPSSHRGTWDRPTNGHCRSCHYPPGRTNCTVCHESVEHASAMRSPHDLVLYPRPCGLCHPGGRPHRAPHPTNSTVRCRQCH